MGIGIMGFGCDEGLRRANSWELGKIGFCFGCGEGLRS